jgi:DNA-binding MarR family transcriptional regulator
MPNLPCLCGSFRRAARALTQLYEEALRPLRMRSAQFTILQVLSRAGEMPQGRLGEMLSMDSTTLTRTLAIMRRHGWITERRGEDRRLRWFRLAKDGERQLRRAEPLWEQVQSRLRRQFGDATWQQLLQLSTQVANVSKNQGAEL